MNLLLPISYIGNIDYWSLISQSENIIIDDIEKFPKQTFRSRLSILAANGIQDLSIPVKKPYEEMRKLQTESANNWKHQHKQSILSAYNSSPYFDALWPEIEWFYTQSHQTDFKELFRLLIATKELIKPDTKQIELLSQSQISDFIDLRNYFKPSKYPQLIAQPAYTQVFTDRYGFVANLCVLDLISNMGPLSKSYLTSLKMPDLVKQLVPSPRN